MYKNHKFCLNFLKRKGEFRMELYDLGEGWDGYACRNCGQIVHFDKFSQDYPQCPACDLVDYDTN